MVKTCCILHDFVHQGDGFQFQCTLYEFPLESIKAVSNRGTITGMDMGRMARDGNVCLLGSWPEG